MTKNPLSAFLSENPFPRPLTLGFFYREKMRAIHHVAPNYPFRDILEIGGGRSGLSALLYPKANITNLEQNMDYASAQCNRTKTVQFIAGDAIRLPFKIHSFDAVTMFDVLEHITDHKKAISETLRVLRPGGYLLVTTPNENWRFPYYGFMKYICPGEPEMMAAWGHVRRGYSLEDLKMLIHSPCMGYANFITPLTVLCHDISFSRFSERLRRAFCATLSPLTWAGYALHNFKRKGIETASVWQKTERAQ